MCSVRAVRASVAVAIAITLGAAAVARADDRVVLIDPPLALARAAENQLAPYRIAVVAITVPTPAGADDAREVAARYDARAVAWVAGAQLVVYNRDDGALITRPAPTPLDDAGAAALALTLKTVLRARWGAAAIAPAPLPPPVLAIAVIPAVRLHGVAAEARFTLGADLEPPGWPIALGVRGSLGAGVPAHAELFSGTWKDRALGAIASRWQPVGDGGLAAGIGLGASLHWTSIDGVLLRAGDSGHATSLNLGFDAEGSVIWRRPPVAFGARAALTWVPWRQVYTVTDVPVFEVSHVEAEIGAVVIFTF